MEKPGRGITLWKSITGGTLVGFFGPFVLRLVTWPPRFGRAIDLTFLQITLLFIGLPSFLAALVGGYSAHFSNDDTIWPHCLLFGIAFAFWVSIVSYFHNENGQTFLLLTLWAANTWVCGWCAIRGVRKARVRAMRKFASYPPGYHDHFASDRRPEEPISPHVRGSLQGFHDVSGNKDSAEDDSV